MRQFTAPRENKRFAGLKENVIRAVAVRSGRRDWEVRLRRWEIEE